MNDFGVTRSESTHEQKLMLVDDPLNWKVIDIEENWKRLNRPLITWVVTHPGIWPVGACTVVTAASRMDAVPLVIEVMRSAGIPGSLEKITEDWNWHLVATRRPNAVNILNGDY